MLPQLPDRLAPGRHHPLGATWDGLGVNFAVFSGHAQKIELCLFDPAGRREVARLALPECTDDVWHGYLPDAKPGLLYGYRAYGPYEPQHGHRFNPNKLLLDPYARQLSGPLRWSDSLYGYRPLGARSDLSFDRRDSAAAMPKAVVVAEHFDWGDDRPPRVPWSQTVIYEAHLRGLSMRRGDIRANERGTFAALCDPRFLDHLRRIGVTAVELLPVHAFMQDKFLLDRALRNYWGYSTLSFFAPEPAYVASGALNELRVAVRRLHAAGIEVILDVVYNHTAEGDELGPTLSLRGLDNAAYYRLVPGDERRYINDTGVGNTVNLSHPRVVQLVMDSLRYWATEFRIDGFRFDLCTTLGREHNGFEQGAGFFDALRQDPVLAATKLIAEPWDVGPGGYQLGNFPPGFAEWNDRFRDGVRRFWRGDAGQRPNIAARLTASADIFEHQHRRPHSSVNYVASHDGFTLADLVAYAHKHNEANGEDNRDGHSEEYSANWGAEGPTDDPAIRTVRGRLQRAMLASVMLAQGTPMLLAGDEFGRTQSGNNNAYCQDNDIAWIDWSLAEEVDGVALSAFMGRLAQLRKSLPVLRPDTYLHAATEVLPGIRDTAWFDETGNELSPAAWNDPEGRCLAFRRAAPGPAGKVDVILLLMNAGAADTEFRLPAPALPYHLLIDSADPNRPVRTLKETTIVAGRSLQLLGASLDGT